MGLVKRCLACADPFQPRPQSPTQSYCTRPECQRERRKLWQRQKRQADNDYRDNQLQCQQRWNGKHPEYWDQYRAKNPAYVQRNREQQQMRNFTRRQPMIAKMGVSLPTTPFPSGTYRLSRVDDTGVAKMDVWIVKIIALSAT